MDMNEIKEIFFQECEEQLAELETGLLAIERGDTDPETVNAVFRAVHSVKGGAGAFSLDDLAAIERGMLRIDDVDLAAYQFTDLCLAGLFRQCIFAYRTKAPSQEEVDHIVSSGVSVFLKAYGTESLAAEESHQMIALEAKR